MIPAVLRAAGLAALLAVAAPEGFTQAPEDPTAAPPSGAPTQTAAMKILVNIDQRSVAVQGYDPVAFFTDGKAVKGSPDFVARHRGAVYYFASAEHRDLFQQDPARYEPAFGGYCAYGAAQGYLAPVEIETWQVHEGRLLLNYNAGVRKRFDKDRARNLAKADRNWPGLVEKEGKTPAR